MKIYTVSRMNKFDYDFTVEILKIGCFVDKDHAINKAKEIFEEMKIEFAGNNEHLVYTEEDDEYGYYLVSFIIEGNYQCHCVYVDDWELV